MLTPIRAFISAVILIVSPAAATAQVTPEQTRAYATWALEVSNFSLETMALMEEVNTALSILGNYTDGTLTRDEADAQIAALRARIEGTLNAFDARAARLLANPPASPNGEDVAVEAMSSLPITSLNSVREFAHTTLTFAEQFLAGEEPDGVLVDLARTEVLKNHYLSLVAVNDTTRDTVTADQPQHHLLNAFALNSRNTAYSFELTRLSMGGALEGTTIEDIADAIARNNEQTVRSVELGRQAQTQYLTLFNTQTPAQMRISAEQHSLIIRLMETYTASFEAELALVDLFSQAPAIVAAGVQTDDWSTWDAWFVELGTWEEARNAAQLSRQQMVAQ